MPAAFDIERAHAKYYETRLGRGSKDAGFDFVKVGEYYVVYAVKVFSGYPYFYVGHHARPNDWFTIPAPCFEILDSRVSRYWHFGMRFIAPITTSLGDTYLGTSSVFAFKEWIEENQFFERLVDCKDRELKLMSNYAALMDIEFGQTAIKEMALTLSDGYYGCPRCAHEWQIDKSNEMVRCPNCSLVMHYEG